MATDAPHRGKIGRIYLNYGPVKYTPLAWRGETTDRRTLTGPNLLGSSPDFQHGKKWSLSPFLFIRAK
jgi:hypothetical protein